MLAKDVMRRRVTAVLPGALVREVAQQLILDAFSGMPVVDKSRRLRGIISASDILRAIKDRHDLRQARVEEYMSPDPITVDADTPLEDVIAIMADNDVARVPVVRNGELVGIITRTDILATVFESNFVTILGE